MKSVLGGVCGAVVALVITLISPYDFVDWQWWAAFLAISLPCIIFAHVEG